MKTTAHVLTLAALAAAFFTAPAHAAKNDRLLQSSELAIHAAGPYVEVGTFRIQVIEKLGWPTRKISESTWLYSNQQVENTDTAGTLVVKFVDGRVSELSLVTPAVVTAMINAKSNVAKAHTNAAAE